MGCPAENRDGPGGPLQRPLALGVGLLPAIGPTPEACRPRTQVWFCASCMPLGERSCPLLSTPAGIAITLAIVSWSCWEVGELLGLEIGLQSLRAA